MAGRLSRGIALIAFCVALVVPASALAVNPVAFSPAGQLGIARDRPGAAALPDGRVVVFGGEDDTNQAVNTAEVWNPATSTFGPLGVTMSTPRWAPIAVAFDGGSILVAGGYEGSDDVASAEILTPAGQFVAVPPMARAREGAAAALLPGGNRVLVAGGYDGDSNTYRDDAEIFNLTTQTWTSAGIGTMRTVHYMGTAAPLADGRILIAGGDDGGVTLNTTEIFDPVTNQFSPGPDLPQPLFGPATAALPGGRVLVAGGRADVNGNLEAIPATGAFAAGAGAFGTTGIGGLANARFDAATAALPDGRVLVVGGFDGAPLKSAEVLSVPSNAFTAKVKGKKVKASVQTEGFLGVAMPPGKHTKKKCSDKNPYCNGLPKIVKSVGAAGGPPSISVRLKLTKVGKKLLRDRGKMKFFINVTFTPSGGVPNTQRLKLKLKD